jgi:mono/diheme cytochrome c family protein
MMPGTSWVAAVIAAAVLAMGGFAVWIISRTEATQPDPNSQSLVARGKTIYAQHCASCHGANLEGQRNWRERLPNGHLPAPPHDATGHTWHHSDKQLFEMVKKGTAGIVPGYETDMPAYTGVLTDADIWALLSYIESTWPPDIRERQQRLNRSSRKRARLLRRRGQRPVRCLS